MTIVDFYIKFNNYIVSPTREVIRAHKTSASPPHFRESRVRLARMTIVDFYTEFHNYNVSPTTPTLVFTDKTPYLVPYIALVRTSASPPHFRESRVHLARMTIVDLYIKFQNYIVSPTREVIRAHKISKRGRF
jgi:hypothetical protein